MLDALPWMTPGLLSLFVGHALALLDAMFIWISTVYQGYVWCSASDKAMVLLKACCYATVLGALYSTFIAFVFKHYLDLSRCQRFVVTARQSC